MADKAQEFDTNPIDWDTATTTEVLEDGLKLWYYNHPDYTGVISFIGDGATDLANLSPHYSEGQPVGEELSIPYSIQSVPVNGIPLSDDTIVVNFMWPDIPKPSASTMTITDPTVGWYITFGNGVVSIVTGLTVSSLVMSQKSVTCTITKVGGFTGADKGIVNWRSDGTGGKFTLA